MDRHQKKISKEKPFEFTKLFKIILVFLHAIENATKSSISLYLKRLALIRDFSGNGKILLYFVPVY